METQITIKSLGRGHYQVNIWSGEVGTAIQITDAQIIDDINIMKSDGFESELVHFETFNEIDKWAKEQLHDALQRINEVDPDELRDVRRGL